MLSVEEHDIRNRLRIKGYTIVEMWALTVEHRLVYRVILADAAAPEGRRVIEGAYPRILQKIKRLPAQ